MSTEISNVRMEPAENGVIISYEEGTKSQPGTYSPLSYKTCKEVYSWKDQDATAKKKEAMDRFCELGKSDEEAE